MKPLKLRYHLAAIFLAASMPTALAADLTVSADVDAFMGAADKAAMRSSLGLAIGTDVQAYSAGLSAWSSKSTPAGTVVGTSDLQALTNKALGAGTSWTAAPSVAIGSDATGDVYYRSSGGGLARLAIGSTGQVLTVASGLPSWANAAGGGGGLTNWTDAIATASPNNTVNAASLTALGSTTNVDAVIRPKGNGALLARIPDASTAGGNKRGSGAVDWQFYDCDTANQVASGIAATIAGGSRNRVTSSYGFAAGYGSAATGSTGSVAIGYINTSSADYAFAAGTVSTASGLAALAIGNGVTASGNYSTATGSFSTTRGLYGAQAHAAGKFSANGDAQRGGYVLRFQTTNSTQSEATLDGFSGTATNRIVLPNGSAYKFRGQAVARDSATGDLASWDITGTIKRGANAAATAAVGTISVAQQAADSGASTWALALDADTTNGSLRVRVTGETSKTIRWVITIETVELQ